MSALICGEFCETGGVGVLPACKNAVKLVSPPDPPFSANAK